MAILCVRAVSGQRTKPLKAKAMMELPRALSDALFNRNLRVKEPDPLRDAFKLTFYFLLKRKNLQFSCFSEVLIHVSWSTRCSADPFPTYCLPSLHYVSSSVHFLFFFHICVLGAPRFFFFCLDICQRRLDLSGPRSSEVGAGVSLENRPLN